MFKVTVKSGLTQLYKWVDSLDGVIANPDIWSNGVRLMGNAFMQNFLDEGGNLGHPWQPLSNFTRQVREERGYNGSHPILVQSGRLRDMAAGRFADWRPLSFRGYMMTDAGQGYDNDGPTSMAASATSRRFLATMTGPKVAHMTGATNAEADYFAGFSGSGRHGMGYMPARPFWDLSGEIVSVMGDAMTDRVMLDWQSKDRRNTRRDSYTRAGYDDGGTSRRRR